MSVMNSMNVNFFGIKFYLFSSTHFLDQFKKNIQTQSLSKYKNMQIAIYLFINHSYNMIYMFTRDFFPVIQ